MNNVFKISGALQIGKLAAAPANPQEGYIYYNTTDKKYYMYRSPFGFQEVALDILVSSLAGGEETKAPTVAAVSSAISAEASTRTAADSSLSSSISSVGSSLSSEASARASADSSLDSKLSSETSTRTAADSSLQSRISAEESARAAADSSLNTRISAEASARIAVEASLDSRVDAEESVRAAADLTFLKLDGSRQMEGDLEFESIIVGGDEEISWASDAAYSSGPNGSLERIDDTGLHDLVDGPLFASGQNFEVEFKFTGKPSARTAFGVYTPATGDFFGMRTTANGFNLLYDAAYVGTGTNPYGLVNLYGSSVDTLSSGNYIQSPYLAVGENTVVVRLTNDVLELIINGTVITSRDLSSLPADANQPRQVAVSLPGTTDLTSAFVKGGGEAVTTYTHQIRGLADGTESHHAATKGQLDAETSARVSLQSAFNSAINTEGSARVSADASLQAYISSALSSQISAEESDRVQSEESLGLLIGAEELARIEADASLESRISAEASARAAADEEFLKLDGSREMQGNLEMGGHELRQVSVIDNIQRSVSTIQAEGSVVSTDQNILQFNSSPQLVAFFQSLQESFYQGGQPKVAFAGDDLPAPLVAGTEYAVADIFPFFPGIILDGVEFTSIGSGLVTISSTTETQIRGDIKLDGNVEILGSSSWLLAKDIQGYQIRDMFAEDPSTAVIFDISGKQLRRDVYNPMISWATAGQVSVHNNKIRNLATPVDGNDATTKSYVDNKDAELLKLDGSREMTGSLTFDYVPAFNQATIGIETVDVASSTDPVLTVTVSGNPLQTTVPRSSGIATASSIASRIRSLLNSHGYSGITVAPNPSGIGSLVTSTQTGTGPEILAFSQMTVSLVEDDGTINYATNATFVQNPDAYLHRVKYIADGVDAHDAVTKGQLDAEASARLASGTSVDSRLSAEESARTAADSSLQSRISAEESARAAADQALDSRVDLLEAKEEVIEVESISSAPGIGLEGSIYVAKDSNKIYRWAISGGGALTFDKVVGAGEEYATLQDALAAAVDGENILVKAGTYSVGSTINVTKQVKIVGEDKATVIFQTAGTSGDPVSMFNVSANNVALAKMTIKHKKTLNTSVETAVVASGGGFPQTRIANFIMEDCVVEFAEFGLVMRGESWCVRDTTFTYATGTVSNSCRAIGIYGTKGDSFIKDVFLKNDILNGTAFRPIYLTSTNGTNPNETVEGKLVIEGVTHVGPLAQFFNQDNGQSAGAGTFELQIKDSVINESNLFAGFASATANAGDMFSSITLSGNTLSNLHTVDGGKGVFGVYGTEAFRTTPLVVHASGNILGQEVYRTGWQSVEGTIVGKETGTPMFSVSLDSVIPASGEAPSALTTPIVGSYIELSADTDLSGVEAQISAEESARASADSSLDSKLSSETSTRTAADSSLQSRISAEESARATADSSLSSLISAEASRASAAETSLETLADSKVSKAGDAMSGNLNMNGHLVIGLSAPVNANDAVRKSYVDALIAGTTWLNPIQDPDLFDDSLSTPPVSPELKAIYIVGDEATGAWSGLEGHALYYDGTSWVDLLDRPVAVGDRFGVAFYTVNPAQGGLVGKDNDVVEIVDATPGAIVYSVTTPDTDQAVYVSQQNSTHFGHSYNYSGTEWVEFGGPGATNAGIGLEWDGNTLNVKLGAGIGELPSDEIAIDLHSASGLHLTENGVDDSVASDAKLSIKIDGSTLSKTSAGIKVAQGGITDTEISASAGIAFSKMAALTADKVLVSDASGVVIASSITAVELGHLSGVESNVQDQLDVKLENVVEDVTPELGGDLDVNGKAIEGASSDIVLAGQKSVKRAKQASKSEFVEEEYIHSISLSASQTDAVISALTFAHASVEGIEMTYKMKDSAGAVRIGTLRVVTNGTDVAFVDTYGDSADLGISFSAAISGSNVEVRYSSSLTTAALRADVKKFLA